MFLPLPGVGPGAARPLALRVRLALPVLGAALPHHHHSPADYRADRSYRTGYRPDCFYIPDHARGCGCDLLMVLLLFESGGENH